MLRAFKCVAMLGVLLVAFCLPAHASNDYVLGVGDKVKIITFGEADLSGSFEVSSTGTISMPLIGEIQATGNTVTQVQSAI